MDSHLELILETLEAVEQGVFHALVPHTVRAMLARAVVTHRDALERYVFLHDLDKANCLTLTYRDGREIAVSWAEWQRIADRIEDQRPTCSEEPTYDAPDIWQTLGGIEKISYYQQSESGKRQHGKIAAERLAGVVGVTDDMRHAIATHEVAYLFETASISRYLEHFGNLDEATRDFCLLASYADTMASLRRNGEPDLTNFLILAKSRLAAEAFVALLVRPGLGNEVVAGSEITDALAKLVSGESGSDAEFIRVCKTIAAARRLDVQKFRRGLMGIWDAADAFQTETVDVAYERIVKIAALPKVNEGKLRIEMDKLVAAGTVEHTLGHEVIMAVLRDGQIPKELGGRLGAANKAVREAVRRAVE